MKPIHFFHAYTPAGPEGALRPVQLTVDDGLIQAVSYDNAPLEGERRIDCGGQVLLPGFIDSHLHLPGSLLYRLHGVELLDCASLEDCQRALEGHTGGSADSSGRLPRIAFRRLQPLGKRGAPANQIQRQVMHSAF